MTIEEFRAQEREEREKKENEERKRKHKARVLALIVSFLLLAAFIVLILYFRDELFGMVQNSLNETGRLAQDVIS